MRCACRTTEEYRNPSCKNVVKKRYAALEDPWITYQIKVVSRSGDRQECTGSVAADERLVKEETLLHDDSLVFETVNDQEGGVSSSM